MRKGIHLSVKAVRELEEDERKEWEHFSDSNRRKTIRELEETFKEILLKSNINDFADIEIKVRIM